MRQAKNANLPVPGGEYPPAQLTQFWCKLPGGWEAEHQRERENRSAGAPARAGAWRMLSTYAAIW